MAAFDQAGQKTAADLNQYVQAWIDRLKQALLEIGGRIKAHRLVVQIEEKEKK